MIKYRFTCTFGHTFDYWFVDKEFYKLQRSMGEVVCPLCFSDEISLHHPKGEGDSKISMLTLPKGRPRRSTVERTAAHLSKLTQRVYDFFAYAGRHVVPVALKMCEGKIPFELIYGLATHEEIKELDELKIGYFIFSTHSTVFRAGKIRGWFKIAIFFDLEGNLEGKNIQIIRSLQSNFNV